MVENFGLYLKHERELRGVPLEEIAGVTKIHIRFLKALEENHFEELPGEVFIKGYIRSYAITIGSDVDEVLNAYDELIRKPSAVPIGADHTDNSDTGTGKKVLAGYIGLGVLLLGIAFGGYYLISKSGSKTEPAKKEMASINPVPETTNPESFDNSSEKDASPLDEVEATDTPVELGFKEPVISSEDVTSSGAETVEKESATSNVLNTDDNGGAEESASLVADRSSLEQKNIPVSSSENPELVLVAGDSPGNEGRMKLVIKVQENSWFNMTVDDFREEDFILPAGTGKSFYGNERFRITIGNRHGTELILNGQVMDLPEGSGNVVKDFIINHQTIE